ncbi:MAG: M24 family metallopeptidase [Actinobacteria bacterium]|nr:M24 family metallopeptidase [Actinomycetota bacterium]
MNNENAEASTEAPEKKKRIHDQAPSELFAEFMRSGWSASDLDDLQPLEVVTYAYARRQVLSAAFPGIRLVLPAGGYKVRANDTDYQYRPHSAFAYYSGVQGADSTADAVLVMEPTEGGHLTYLYIHPRSTRDTDAFYRDAKYGELWVGRRYTLAEAKARYQIDTRLVNDLEGFLKEERETLIIRGEDAMVDGAVKKHDREEEFVTFVSEQRLVKDPYEIAEMQKAVDASALGFNDVISVIPAAVATPRGERVLEAAFYGRARVLGNDLGYSTIVGAGAHACVLHWIRNDGDVHMGELVLVDAGVEVESFYTADITRTLPVSGKFTPAQRSLYMLVYESQLAGFAAIKPGVKFSEINKACQEVLARGLADMGVLTVSAEESLKPEIGLHRRWTLHGVSHHLGLDVHDCAQARKENYMDKELEEGMVLTVEPGLYIQPDDELFEPEYRGIGIRIEDDVVVTADGCRNLSEDIPRHPDEIEKWMKSILR